MAHSAATSQQPAANAPAKPGAKGERLVFIDALRGIAALAVAVYHLERYSPLDAPASLIWGSRFDSVMEHGWMGVQVFFVISGFVIAYSLRDAWVTPRYLGNYALRRSLRLDPPYWVTIAIALALHYYGPTLLGVPSPMEENPPPTGKQIAWHALYLQNVMGYDNLSAGLWTLCIEVQFYLLYTVMLGVVQTCCGRDRWEKLGGGAAILTCFAPLGFVSLVVYKKEGWPTFGGIDWLRPFTSDVCVLHFFWMFFLGMLIHWTLEGRAPKWIFWTYLAVMAARYAWFNDVLREVDGVADTTREWTIEIAVAGLAGMTIFVIGRRGQLATVGRQRWLQFLGRISYSLYLIHYPVSHVIVHLAHRKIGDNPWLAVLWMAVALASAIAAGWLLYLCVERPSLRFAARFRPRVPLPSPRYSAGEGPGVRGEVN